jgi:signal transduction histidine kinase
MFDPFFTTKTQGLGLGLSISRSIVEAHSGRIWATRNPGQGLTMHILLPAAPVEASVMVNTIRPGG